MLRAIEFFVHSAFTNPNLQGQLILSVLFKESCIFIQQRGIFLLGQGAALRPVVGFPECRLGLCNPLLYGLGCICHDGFRLQLQCFDILMHQGTVAVHLLHMPLCRQLYAVENGVGCFHATGLELADGTAQLGADLLQLHLGDSAGGVEESLLVAGELLLQRVVAVEQRLVLIAELLFVGVFLHATTRLLNL